mmetsp:Transcript_34592/g.90575  ORF Transcript_34592/g.90575 Transcript_34592/m.90575 type:complete len:214 (-) Transcript_34592:279-920(-)
MTPVLRNDHAANLHCTHSRWSSSVVCAALRAFEYERKRVVLHTDASLMPPLRRDWSPLNIVVDPRHDAASVTVWMNRIDHGLRSELGGVTLFQTWNPHAEPEAATVKYDYSFERPVVTFDSAKAMQQLQDAQGRNHVWFVGAYARFSMPLLENGVKSSMEVARRLGIDCSDVEFDEARSNAAADARRGARHRALAAAVVGLTAAAAALYVARR